MNPMKEALKRKKANSINLTIILEPHAKKPLAAMQEKPALEIDDSGDDDDENDQVEPVMVDEMALDEKKRKLMERAKLAAMGKR